jgi:A/G-specific adenine glycosylase
MNPSSPLPRRAARTLAQALVDWYREHARDLPWRRSTDPYAIWVSEVMLQQTRVEAVLGRYERFLRRFPTAKALAEASEADVLAEWAGLGYYRRARQLHAAAGAVMRAPGGRLPNSAAKLRLLPGFGAYTAGAVASLAFGESVPAIDGNVERVISRLLALSTDPKRAEAAHAIHETASRLLEHAAPNDLKQALMELGALVCTPRSPRCGSCPWARTCAARGEGNPQAYPRRAPRREPLDVAAYAAVAERDGRYLWRQRPPGGHNAGLWELPTTAWHGGAADDAAARRELVALSRELNARWTVEEPLARVRHGITHRRIVLVAYRVVSSEVDGASLRWGSGEDGERWGMTAASRKLLRKLPALL